MSQIDNKKIIHLILVYLYVLFSHIYFICRYSGRWGDWDSSFMVKAFQAVYEEATILPTTVIYENGFGSQVIASFIVNISNITIQEYSLIIHPIITTVYVFIAYSLFFQLTGKHNISVVSTLLISLQPEFFWTSARNTHEGFTYLMVLIAIFSLTKSISMNKETTQRYSAYVVIFYTSIMCMISLNSFFASSFIITMMISFIVLYIMSKKIKTTFYLKRFIYMPTTCIVLIFTYMFYIYAPAENFFIYSVTFMDKIASLFNVVDAQSTPQYEYIYKMWVSPYIWFLLTLFNWIIAFFSFIMFLKMSRDLAATRKRIEPKSALLLSYYFSYSLLLVIYIFADRFGEYASNMELRIFPLLMIFAVPLASILFFKVLNTNKLSIKRKKAIQIFILIFIVASAGNSLIKGTSDPIVSNKWIYYSEHEEYGIKWVATNLYGKSINAELDERLLSVFYVHTELSSYRTVSFTDFDNSQYYFYSDVFHKRAERLNYPIPITKEADLIYNNYDVKIYNKHKYNTDL